MNSRYLKILLVMLVFAVITALAMIGASELRENELWQSYIRSSGILGVIVVGIVCGLNAFVPIPPATFAPMFLEAGLSSALVVAGFVVGTTIADSIGYLLGVLGRGYVNDNHPRVTNYLKRLFSRRADIVPYAIFGFFAIAPLPNETILIPLALIGYSYKKIIVPLILGNIIHHTIMVFGYAEFFSIFF